MLKHTSRRVGGKPERPSGKPGKPRPDFPLSIHKGTGYWCKKVRGHVHYFGKVSDDPNGVAAEEQWLAQKEDLQRGYVPREKPADGLRVRELVNDFLTFKQEKCDRTSLSVRTFQSYHSTCEIVCEEFGRDRAVENLCPDDFRKLRTTLAKRRGDVALRNEIIRVAHAVQVCLYQRPDYQARGLRQPF